MKKKCACSLTQDGECETCKAMASSAGVRFKAVFNEMMSQLETLEKEFMEKIEALKVSGNSFAAVGQCNRCVEKYIDFAMSKMILGLDFDGGERRTAFGVSLVKSIQSTCAKRGINHLPLTEKAWADIKGSFPR